MSRTTWILTSLCVTGLGLGVMGCESHRKTTSSSMDQNSRNATASNDSSMKHDSGLFSDKRIRTDSQDSSYGRMERTSGGSAVTITGPFNANGAPPLQAPQGQALQPAGTSSLNNTGSNKPNSTSTSTGSGMQSGSMQSGTSTSGTGAAQSGNTSNNSAPGAAKSNPQMGPSGPASPSQGTR